MSLATVKTILATKYGSDIAEKLLNSYLEVEQNHFLEKWKPSELDAGHFVETVRRMIEFEQNGGAHTPFTKSLPDFNDVALKQYESGTGHESFRMLIPRVLKAIYNIRNKRGVGHIKDISPNEMDATLILYSVKWVLAEITRLASNKTPEETQKLIDNVIERQVEVIWKEDGFKKILDTRIDAKNQILILLYDESPQNSETLRQNIEYKNKSIFEKLLKGLHDKKLIDFRSEVCKISPTGRLAVEQLLKQLKEGKGK